MTSPIAPEFAQYVPDDLATLEGRIAIFVTEDGKMDLGGRRVNALSKKSVARLLDSEKFGKMSPGSVAVLAFPAGMAADAVLVVKLNRRPKPVEARNAGVAIAKVMGEGDLTVLGASTARVEDVALGICLRAYNYHDHKTAVAPKTGKLTVMVSNVDESLVAASSLNALANGVFFTRDLVNAPANHLTTTEFAEQLVALKEHGVKVKVLEEDELEKLGMGSLLCVGLGSSSPTKMVVMEWNGGGDEAPFALVGKGVVFDTGGISLKPAVGMEDMTMDMGGAGTVAGVMKTLAMRKAKANVVGLVGLVENMPGSSATRPGDVVTSMKGDTIEVINTDAEGRLVLADVLWYAQETYKPVGMINLATLTGAIIIGLGHDNAGVFSNSDDLAGAFLKAAKDEDEGAWRMPMGQGYDDLLKSRIADMKNIGGRPAGSITAAQFLKRFVKDDVPWCHLDIAGVALLKGDGPHAPKGATGWGVLALNRLIADKYEA